MPLRKQPLPLAFAGGLETKQDEKQVDATRLLVCENATFTKVTTISKRNGYDALPKTLDGGGEYDDPVGMATARDGEIHLFTSGRGYTYRSSVSRWASAGDVSSVVATADPAARTGTVQTQPDHATNGGVTVYAWEDSRGGVWCSIAEATGRLLLAPVQLDASGTRPRVSPCGSVIHVYWVRAASQRIYVASVNPVSAAAAPTPVILTEDLSSSNPSYDVTWAGLGSGSDERLAMIAWVQNGGGWRVGYVHPSGVLGGPSFGLPSVGTHADVVTSGMAIAWDRVNDDNAGVVFTTATAVRVAIVASDNPGSATISTEYATGNGTRTVVEYGTNLLWWAVEYAGARSDLNTIVCGSVALDASVTATSAAGRVLRGHTLASKAYVDDGEVWCCVAHPVEFFPYAAIVRLSSATFGGSQGTVGCALLEPGTSTGAPTRNHVPSVHDVAPSSTTYTSRSHRLLVGRRLQLDSEDGDQFSEAGFVLVTLDHDHASSHQSAQLGRGLYLAGAQLSHHDGARWAEANFRCAPDVSDGAAAIASPSASGGSMADGTYSYLLCYEEVDAQGELHRGPMSVPITAEVSGGGGNGSVSLALPTYRLTNKIRARIGVFRSPVNQTGDQASIPYYRVTNTDPSDTSGENCFVANDPTVDTITFVDDLSDATLRTREPAYSNGGILSNDPAPMSGVALVGGKSRLFWVDPLDRNVVRFSQEIAEDVAVEPAVALRVQVDPYGGDITALAVMDDAVYVFKESAIYVFGGPGPLAAPGVGDAAFTPAALVTTDVGCSSASSICQSPLGIVFSSSKGIMMLDRTRQIVDIGAPVYAYKDQRISRATLLPDRHQILLLTDAAAGSTLLFDYARGQWSTFTNHVGIDAAVVDGAYHYLRSDGRIFVETIGEYADDNSHIVRRVATAWIRMTGYLQGWQRVIDVQVIGKYLSAHTLRMRYRTDYDDDWSAPIDADVNANYSPDAYGGGAYGDGYYGGVGGDVSRYQRRFHINRRCQAIQFMFEDVEATDTYGAAFELSELLLTGGVLGPRMPVGAARNG